MRLVVSTPTSVVEEVQDLVRLRAEDESGAFGILPGHADLVTVLPVSVVTWAGDGREGVVLVRGGVLRVTGGNLVEIAARGAWREDELETLSAAALADLQLADETEDETRTSDSRLHLAAMRQIERVLRSGREATGVPPRLDHRPEDASA